MDTPDHDTPSPTGDGPARTADIIPFPRRPPPASPASAQPTPVAAGDSPMVRLDRALEMLKQALIEQRQAVEEWRDSASDLASTMRALAEGLTNLDDELETAANRLKEHSDTHAVDTAAIAAEFDPAGSIDGDSVGPKP